MFKCPYCNYDFVEMAENAADLMDRAPVVCEACARVCLLDHGACRVMDPVELYMITISPIWEAMIAPFIAEVEARRRKASAAGDN